MLYAKNTDLCYTFSSCLSMVKKTNSRILLIILALFIIIFLSSYLLNYFQIDNFSSYFEVVKNLFIVSLSINIIIIAIEGISLTF